MSAPTADQDVAFRALLDRVAAAEDWAARMDDAYLDHGHAKDCVRKVDAVFDGPFAADHEGECLTLMACYTVAVETAVIDASFDYASITQHPLPAGHVTNPPRRTR